MDLNETLVFLKVIEEGSFTAAARHLETPKTTISRKVKALENRLGVQLLHRTTRKLSLTEGGVAYFQKCRGIPGLLADADEAARSLHESPRGTLRITTPNSLAVHFIGPLLGQFHTQYPALRIDLALEHQVRDLISDDVDVALRLGGLPDSSLAARRLGQLPNHVYASPGYLNRYGTPQHPRELINHHALVTRVARTAEGYVWPMENQRESGAFEIVPVIEADDPEVLKAPLSQGVGLMMATDLIMADLYEEGIVERVVPNWRGRCPELHAVFPKGHFLPRKLRVFIDFLVANTASENPFITR